ncbi:hypothetical protein [Streptomyces sp. NBC_01235]|uniref:hypothetical protein n=1 Tax=Streptomyces sp. NBC_01235 TaxID=2903788 RepID=UPI002E0D719A|nr:hypothetical protein OG289_46185 [Streptomyces sp. NBC_01235]
MAETVVEGAQGLRVHPAGPAARASPSAADDASGGRRPRAIAEALRPAQEATVKTRHADPVDAVIRRHANRTAAEPRSDDAPAPLVKKSARTGVSASCSLDTGRVGALTGAPSV